MLNARTFKLAAAPLAVAAALAIGACGGDDDEDTIALSAWITQADTICAESGEEIDEQAEATFSGDEEPSAEELESFVNDTVLPEIRGQHVDLTDLPEPDENADTVDEMLNELDQGIDEIEEDPAAFIEAEETDSFDRANELATEVGLEECGEE